MDTQKQIEFEKFHARECNCDYDELKRRLDHQENVMGHRYIPSSPSHEAWLVWDAAWKAKAQAVPAQLDVNSILHDIDCYFDNGLSNTERTANNLLQSIYEKLSGEVKAQEPAND